MQSWNKGYPAMRFATHTAREDDSSSGLDGGGQPGNGRLFAQAILLARKGRYADASKLLPEALRLGQCTESEALDLQARIYAQQGQHLHAESCWRKAMGRDSSNPVYADALARLQRIRRPWPVVRTIGFVAAALAVVIVAMVIASGRDATVLRTEELLREDLRAISETSVRQHQAHLATVTDTNAKWSDTVADTNTKWSDTIAALAQQVQANHTATEKALADVAHQVSNVQSANLAVQASVSDLTDRLNSIENRLSGQIAGLHKSWTAEVIRAKESDRIRLQAAQRLAAALGGVLN